MKVKHLHPRSENTKPARMEPMAEGPVPLRMNGHRNWGSMGDMELVHLAKRFMAEEGIRSRKNLDKADRGLYSVLQRRKLLEFIEFEEEQVQREHRKWGTDEEIVALAKKLVAEMGIRNRGGLGKADQGLYRILQKRNLLDRLELKVNRRDWGSDEDIVAFAKSLVAEKGIKSRSGLGKVDRGLHQVLLARKLLDKVEFKERQVQREHRSWGADEETISFAKKFMEENRISHPGELAEAYPGLYSILLKRNLLDLAGFKESRRKWGADEEVLAIANKFIADRGIRNKYGLRKADSGLYKVLRKRGFLDAAFSEAESSKHREAVNSVIDALDSFGDDG